MLLAKSCKKEHNIKNGNIRLGTLYEYRSIENDELVDKREGMLDFFLRFRGQVEVPTQWFCTISEMAIGDFRPIKLPGRQSSNFIKLTLVSQNDTTVILRDSLAIFSHESPNCFIFCVSRVRKTRDCVGIFNGYDDYWFLNETRAYSFSLNLATTLLEYIRQQHTEKNYIVPKDTDMTSLEVLVENRPVEYLGRDVELYGNVALPLEKFAEKIRNMSFLKPEKHRNEMEYRFSFTLISKGRIVEPIVKSVFLDSSSLLAMIF
ncbi:hypothetical protein [Pseudomonas sp. PNP]|uniref:hypothetical protein n=1 Tax=Pseudomonas sp. PNP TaxID=361819 RepID=UPI001AECC72F|nr:hypothetical protein [Pseudomonas sp. PNP]MBP2841164.1 hypothetical protein [Pseudomonas sp. PNP]